MHGNEQPQPSELPGEAAEEEDEEQLSRMNQWLKTRAAQVRTQKPEVKLKNEFCPDVGVRGKGGKTFRTDADRC